MFPLHYALAVALLTTPPDTKDSPAALAPYAAVRPVLQDLALSWEVLDERECRYVLTRPEDLASDLKMLRRRQDDLADAPPLYDCRRFPDRNVASDLLAFNRAYRQHLESRQALEVAHRWELHEAQEETDRLFLVWDHVRDARCDVYYVNVRRQALKKLRDALGMAAYYSGTLPPHVPVWRFARID